jgi:hypothetical protein
VNGDTTLRDAVARAVASFWHEWSGKRGPEEATEVDVACAEALCAAFDIRERGEPAAENVRADLVGIIGRVLYSDTIANRVETLADRILAAGYSTEFALTASEARMMMRGGITTALYARLEAWADALDSGERGPMSEDPHVHDVLASWIETANEDEEQPMQSPPTNYEVSLPPDVQEQTELLMASWRDEGRDDDRIEQIVHSVVLRAYAAGQRDLRGYLNEVIAQPGLRRPTVGAPS